MFYNGLLGSSLCGIILIIEAIVRGGFRTFEGSTYALLIAGGLFMLRRISVAFIIVYMQDKSFFQIQLIAFLSSLVMVYQGIYKPQQSKTHNRVEMFNEVMNLLSTYPLFLFTDFVLDKEA